MLSLLGTGICQAQVASTDVILSVTVLEKPSCVINDNRPIEVSFGEVLTSKIDGAQYAVSVTYNLKCKNAGGQFLRMNILGKVSSFDSMALDTSVSGLGIRLYTDGQALRPGATYGYLFAYSKPPVLKAVPVKAAAFSLPGGGFSATATLEVEIL